MKRNEAETRGECKCKLKKGEFHSMWPDWAIFKNYWR